MSENVVAVEAMFSRFKVNIDRLNNDLNVLKSMNNEIKINIILYK